MVPETYKNSENNYLKRTGKRESKDSPRWARSFNTKVLSLSSESDNADISASSPLMKPTVEAYCCLVDSPVSFPLNIPPKRPPNEAIAGICLPPLRPDFAVLDPTLNF